VLVLPSYHPVRLAEEIAMLNTLTSGTLHLGIGRGTAKSEYDAFGVDMNEARGRFRECYEIIEKGLSGERFSYDGTYYKISRPIELRPKPPAKRVHFYGAIGSPASAGIMGDLGIAPICLSTFPDRLLTKILESWRSRARTSGKDPGPNLPISVKMLIADTDADARRLGEKHFPPYFELQTRHYEVDAGNWDGIPDYQDFTKMFANLKKLTQPSELGPYMDANLVGSVETVSRRLAALASLGFNYFMVSSATPGIPRDLRRETMARFAHEVAPRFSSRFGRQAAAE
jgi:alkanesulfonate monooxygenase SsuD/methylene tetrahydromethanopterin reductase-like flavin-dependent oxidoreductase (luciferase family)